MSVGADIAHIGTAAPADRPNRFHFAGSKINDRNAAFAMRARLSMRAAIGDIKLAAVAADTQAMCSNPSCDEADFTEAVAIDQINPVGHHVGDIKDLTVGRDPDVLRHAWLGELEVTENLEVDKINLDKAPVEFTAEDHIPAVAREVGMIEALAM